MSAHPSSVTRRYRHAMLHRPWLGLFGEPDTDLERAFWLGWATGWWKQQVRGKTEWYYRWRGAWLADRVGVVVGFALVLRTVRQQLHRGRR